MKIFALTILLTLTILSCNNFFAGGDHDIVAYKIINLREKLGEKSMSDLKTYALTLEKYNNNGKTIFGGIHDYIDQLSRADLNKYILTVCLKKKELLEEEKFFSVVEGDKKTVLAEEPVVPKIGGLHDYIWRVDHETLIRWALTAQEHENRMSNTKVVLDYKNMKVEEIIMFTLKMAEKYPGLDSSTELDRLAQKYGVKTNPFTFGGLHDYLYRQKRETLIRWALTGEAHERKVKNIETLGGLHDYVYKLSEVEIADIVADYAKKYPELNNGEKLDSLAKEYKIVVDQASQNILKLGGLHDYIFRTDRKTLIKWALTCEAHDKKERGIDRTVGGLHDYIGTMSNQKIAEYVLGVAAVYPVLNSAESLDTLFKKYEIKYTEGPQVMKFLQ